MVDADEEAKITIPLRAEDASDADKIREVIRLLNLAIEECRKLLKDAEDPQV